MYKHLKIIVCHSNVLTKPYFLLEVFKINNLKNCIGLLFDSSKGYFHTQTPWSYIFPECDGSGSFDPCRFGSIFCVSDWVSYLWFEFGFGKFPLKMSNFSIFCRLGPKKSLRVGSKSTWTKDGSASYLLRVKSILGLCQGPSLVLFNPSWMTN